MKSYPLKLAMVGALVIVASLLVVARETDPSWAVYQDRRHAAAGDGERGPQVISVIVAATGTQELCLTCHDGIEETSSSHPVELGCTVCHGGQPLALDADVAHQGLVGKANPSSLDVAARGCGDLGPGGEKCHGGGDMDRDHVARVTRSLQATYTGGINTVLKTFTGFDQPVGTTAIARDERVRDGLPGVVALTTVAHGTGRVATTASDLEESCIDDGCHLSTTGGEVTGSVGHAAGCAACHVARTDDEKYAGDDPTMQGRTVSGGGTHEFTTAIPFEQCNTCHNRGIYDLRGLEFYPRDDVGLAEIAAGSPASYYRPNERYAACEVNLNCIDCHTQAEAMGDGRLLPDKTEAQKTRCLNCHGTPTDPPPTRVVLPSDSTLLALGRASAVYEVRVGDRLATAGGANVLSSAQWIGDVLVVTDKVDGARHEVPPVRGSACEQDGSSQGSDYCHTCHYQEAG